MKTKVKFDKDITIVCETGEARNGISPFTLTIGILPLGEYRNEKVRIDFDGIWYQHDNGDKSVIALKTMVEFGLRERSTDKRPYQEELMKMYHKFCDKYIDLVGHVRCEKQMMLLFLNRTFNVRELKNWTTFREVTWPSTKVSQQA